MRPRLFYLNVCLISLMVLGACAAPIATSSKVDAPITSFLLIEFYSPL